MTRFAARLAALTATAVSALLLGTGPAGAQIPGALDTGMVVVTDSSSLRVSVDPAVGAATVVTGRITNTTSATFSCYTPGLKGVKFPGQVTEALVVAKSMRYYSTNIFTPIGGFTPPTTGVTLDPLPTGSLMDLLPTGSFNRALGAPIADQLDIRAAQEAARVAGHTGDPTVNGAVAFDVPAGATSVWSATLSVPPTGVRTDFAAAAMFFCTDTSTSRPYVFAGYEGGVPPTL